MTNNPEAILLMPELPEVETTRRGIEPHLIGERVASVIVRQPKLRWEISPELAQMLSGQVILSVERRAKYLLINTVQGQVMIHLGMSGSLRILDSSTPAETHDHVDFVLQNGRMLRYHDPRRFGSIFWLNEEYKHALLENLGPEPLSAVFDINYLYAVSRSRKTLLKSFLMDGRVVVGVGNIYANEALYMAGIRPDIPAGKPSRVRYLKLVNAVKQVLSEAIEAGGTSLKDFVREDGSPGYFKQSLNVYGRGGEPCLGCSRALTEIRLGQRTTVFCTRCQT
jgi:formamidopyrimidine-DNA glycosylase